MMYKKERNYTTMTVEDENGVYHIKRENTELPLSQMVEDFVVPMLLAMGYQKESINEYIEET